ncbi:MAG: ABC transporter permease subunit [Rhodoferax sp.]|nr:ABC transporter permease subunit [Rhodoferax sp.]
MRGPLLLRLAPWITLSVFLLPVFAGLLGTLLPALGYLPAAGGYAPGWDSWRTLFAEPGFATSVRTTVVTGVLATILSVAIALGFGAWAHHRRWASGIGRWLAPLLAMPHSALAIGLAFLIAPSGWLVRAISPGWTGWTIPPDVSTVGHPSGWPLILGLLIKEVPYLGLMTLGALGQVSARAHVAAARALGYGPVESYIKVVLPQIYPQLRLPIFAVLAFSLSVVDVGLILGPGNPPTLAVLAVRWFAAPDVSRYFPAAAAAILMLLIVTAGILVWVAAERLLSVAGRRWIERGRRRSAGSALAAASGAFGLVLYALAIASLLAMLLWSFAQQWRYPDALPSVWTTSQWTRQLSSVAQPFWNTLAAGILSTLIALILTVACLENESVRRGGIDAGEQRPVRQRRLMLLYLPLLVPQVAFLFGAQVLLVRLGLDGTLASVVGIHLVFVLPYLFLSLADPWRAFDARYTRAALSLGASRQRTFWRVKLPLLLKPTLIACAVAFAVSAGQFLPTLFAGGGRVATLTTEAVTLAAGADRRVIGVWALLQSSLPLGAFLVAACLPWLLYRNRKGMT